MYYIENEFLKAGFLSHGAELRSLVDKTTGEEFMWSGDPEYWGRVSPVLFPVVGNYKDKTSIYKGREYSLSQHGFARDSEFTVLASAAEEISFSLSSSEDTKKVYPFDFTLMIDYKLHGRSLSVLWKVINKDGGTMHFSIGGHPAFNLRDKETVLKFYDIEGFSAGILEGGLLSDRTKEIKLSPTGTLKPTTELFAEDALIIEHTDCGKVSLIDKNDKEYLSVSFNAPLFGIWSPAGKEPKFVCIEPWYGRTDRTDFDKELTHREYGNVIASGETFTAGYSIEVCG